MVTRITYIVWSCVAIRGMSIETVRCEGYASTVSIIDWRSNMIGKK